MTTPSVFKSPLLKELGIKPPKVRIKPHDTHNKEDKKHAKILQELINYMFENNTNGITDKYIKAMKYASETFVQEQVYGIKVNWDTTQKAIEKIIKEDE